MKLNNYFSKLDSNISITPTEVLEYLFCPRFIYFMKCLDIPQNEENRIKVQIGRQIHEKRALENKDYRRKKIGCVYKEQNVYLKSEKYNVRGKIDEILFLKDGTMAPLDYKFAEYKDKIFETYKMQLVIYALLIEENYKKNVNKGFICYTRSNSILKEIEITEFEIEKIKKIISEIVLIIQKGLFPRKSNSKFKCIDCCYKNICV